MDFQKTLHRGKVLNRLVDGQLLSNLAIGCTGEGKALRVSTIRTNVLLVIRRI